LLIPVVFNLPKLSFYILLYLQPHYP